MESEEKNLMLNIVMTFINKFTAASCHTLEVPQPHKHTHPHFKQTPPNKKEIDTLYIGPYYFSPWNYGGSYNSDFIVLIGATDHKL